MARYLILGAGKFGRLAVERLARQDEEASFLVVDESSQALTEARALLNSDQIQVVQGEAVAFLLKFLQENPGWDWTIPMVPVHVAFQWLWQGPLAGLGWHLVPVPEEVEKLAPHVQHGKGGELYLSRATHLCPDDCSEPDFCPVTDESREIPLYGELAALKLPGFHVTVLPCRQLAPGVGGFPGPWLPALGKELASLEGNVLIATACRCHGVVNALARRSGRPS
jgi:hypothetical protein